MASIGPKLASLVVDIVINTRRLQSTLNQSATRVNQTANQMRSALTRVGLAASGFLLIRKAAEVSLDSIVAVIEASAKLEKQIIDIAKVAKFPDFEKFAAGFVKLGQTLKGVSFAQLGEIGADLARLGLRGGSKSFLEFLEASSGLSQVTGDIDLRQAGEGIGKILANFGKLGDQAGENALQLSVAINKLSDDFPVTAGEILNVTQKLSGFAKAVGMTQEQTLALTTLIKQTGISSTVVESSITRLLITLEKDPHKVGAALGKTGKEVTEFANLVATDAFSAIKQFFDFLKKADASTAVKTLVDLELATSRNAVGYLNAVAKIEDWDKALQAATVSGESMLAFFNKQNATMETLDARIINLKNSWDAFKASLGDATGFKTAIDGLTGLLQKFTDFETKRPETFKDITDIPKAMSKLRQERKDIGGTGAGLGIGALLNPLGPIGSGAALLGLGFDEGRRKEIENQLAELQKQHDKLMEQLFKDAEKVTENLKEKEAKIKAQNDARLAQFDEALKEFSADVGDDPFAELDKKAEEFKKEFADIIDLKEFQRIVGAKRKEIQDKIDEKLNAIQRAVEEDIASIHFDKFKEFGDMFADVEKLAAEGGKHDPKDSLEAYKKLFEGIDKLKITAFDLSTSPKDHKNKITAIQGRDFAGEFLKLQGENFEKLLNTQIGDSLLGKFDLPSLDKLNEFSILMGSLGSGLSKKTKDAAFDSLFPKGERKFTGLTEAWKEAQTKSSVTKEQITVLKDILTANGISNEILGKIQEKIELSGGALK